MVQMYYGIRTMVLVPPQNTMVILLEYTMVKVLKYCGIFTMVYYGRHGHKFVFKLGGGATERGACVL